MKHKSFFALLLSAGMLLSASCSDDDTQPYPEPKPEPKPEIPVEDPSDLSAKGSANCYLVNTTGSYSFDATVMGNGVATDGATVQKMAPAAVQLLWQDAEGLIRNLRLEEGRVKFDVEQNPGNALVAVTDQDGKTLWSWHIWVTNYNPDKDFRKFNGVNWMDRNIGAKSAEWDAMGTCKGMVYQWGRKDPFPAHAEWMDMGTPVLYDADGALCDPLKTEVVSVDNNLANAIANPTTFYGGIRNGEGMGPYDWYTTNDYSKQNNKLWSKTEAGEKTMFDPCPPGWKVPSPKHFKGLNNNSFPDMAGEENRGRIHDIIGFFPYTGQRGFEGGQWVNVGGVGDYWSAQPSTKQTDMAHALHFLPALANTRGQSYRASGFPVRCVSEKEEAAPDDPNRFDEVLNTPILVEGSYIKGNGVDGSANYYIGFSDVEVKFDEQTQMMVPAQPGHIVFFDLYGDPSEDSENAIIPDGVYEFSDMAQKGNAFSNFTWIREANEELVVDHKMFTSGKITVARQNKEYSVTGDFITTDGLHVQINYKGEINLINRGKEDVQTVIINPVNATFDSVDVIYEHSDKGSENPYDRFSINLWDGELTSDGQNMADGYVVHLDLIAEQLSNKGDVRLKPGIYTVNNSQDFIPGTLMPGAVYNLIGVPLYVGSYCIEARPQNRALLYGFAVKGTVEVKHEGSQYEFIVDFTTPEQVPVKGIFKMNDINIVDNSPEVPDGDWNSILHEDKQILMSETDDIYAHGYNYGSAYHAGTSHFELFIHNHTTNESSYLVFMAPEGAKTPVGKYTAAKDPANPQPGEYVPGYKDLSVFAGTWSYVLWEGSEEVGGAPGIEGDLVITEGGEAGQYHFEFALKDDATPCHTVSASWTVPVNIAFY